MTTDDVTKNDGGDKWTPGPWYVMGDDEVPDGIPVVEIARGECPSPEHKQIAYVQPSGCDAFELTDEDRANAALIAAAPDMAEALEAALVVCEAENANATAAIVRAALAKARGQS